MNAPEPRLEHLYDMHADLEAPQVLTGTPLGEVVVAWVDASPDGSGASKITDGAIPALLTFDSDRSAAENAAALGDELRRVRTGGASI